MVIKVLPRRPSLGNFFVTNLTLYSLSLCRRKDRAIKSPGDVAYDQEQRAFATLAWLPTKHQQVMFHRNFNWMVGLCFVRPLRLQGDSFVANCSR
jgi:hypothetical protein